MIFSVNGWEYIQNTREGGSSLTYPGRGWDLARDAEETGVDSDDSAGNAPIGREVL